jgi:alkyl sulfatase BDS1-like metallo-beta-lactamase superfamily hydrolase
MPTTVKDFFDTRVPEALLANPGRAKEVAAVYLFKISGDKGGTWTADLLATPPTCTAGATGQAQCTIEVSDQDFITLVDGGAQAAMQIILAGRLKIGGNPALIAKLMGVLQMGA